MLPRPALAAEAVHVVVKGQTLGRIAKRYNVPLDVLRSVNDLRPGQSIKPGLPLVIPEKGKEAEAAKKAAAMRQSRSDKKTPGGRAAKEDDDSDDAKVDSKTDGKKLPKSEKGKPKLTEKDRGRGKEKDREDESDKGRGKEKELPKDKGRDSGERAGTYVRKPKRAGFVKLVRGTETLSAQLLTRQGRLVPAALPGVSRMLRFSPTGATMPIDPRLATLIGMVSDHFGGRPIRVVSGFRPYSPRQYTRHSKHNAGHAVDFSVEGVPNVVVRDYCRSFRNSGVGYYPNSSFVHMDVRTTKVYWVDYSRPGEPPRYHLPNPRLSTDESVDDLDTHETGVEGGSKETSPPGTQAPDSSEGNRDTQGLEELNPQGAGHADPPSPTPLSLPSPPSPPVVPAGPAAF